jgi:phage shock protein PspC (stress-responsive transcriptional regulator)
MHSARPNLFTRPDTMFGVCQGMGEDLGINPNYLRLALPLPLFLFPVATIATYAALGVVVFATRWLIPDRPVGDGHVSTTDVAVEPVIAVDQDPLPLAA